MSDKLGWRGSRRRLLRDGATVGAGLAGLALVGCGDDDDDTTPQPGGTTAGAPTRAVTAGSSAFKLDKQVDIGFISSFTGPLATIYAPFVNGARLAISEINEKGGVGGQQMKLIEADDQSKPGKRSRRGPGTRR